MNNRTTKEQAAHREGRRRVAEEVLARFPELAEELTPEQVAERCDGLV